MGFGGVGESGMGAYHGKVGFEAFSHTKSILEKKTWLDLPMRYQPYNRKRNEKLLRLFLR
jgi:aldehyde dehydrogenase (NAD+)